MATTLRNTESENEKNSGPLAESPRAKPGRERDGGFSPEGHRTAQQVKAFVPSLTTEFDSVNICGKR